MDCFGTYFTHVHICNVARVQSATEWTASVHTVHMSTPVMYQKPKTTMETILAQLLNPLQPLREKKHRAAWA